MFATVLGMGSALPARQLDQADATRLVERLSCQNPKQARVLSAIFEKACVDSRGSVLIDTEPGEERDIGFFTSSLDTPNGPTTASRMARYERESVPLALAAATRAIEDAGFAPDAITHLITVSCTGFFAPGIDVALIKGLGLRPDVARTHVGFMGCHGALNGLQVARAIALSDPAARVLLCATELCTLHLQYAWSADNVVANALFADSAAAVVIGIGEGQPEPRRRLDIAATGSYVLPESEDAMSWKIGDHGFVMTLSSRVPDLIQSQLTGFLQGWLKKHGLSIAEIASWGVHPGGPRILTAVEEALHLEPSALEISRAVLAGHGNMSSPTILIILEKMRAANAPKPCVLLAFGPGLVVEAVLVT